MKPRIAQLSALLLAFIAPAHTVFAQSTESPAQQVLDRVFAYDTKSVLNMAFSNADADAGPFTDLGVSGSTVATCTLTAVKGLWCLDGKVVRNWPNPLQPTEFTDPINCADPALGFETAIPASCTAMTVDESGAIWLGGKKRKPANWPTRPSWIPEEIWVALQTWFKPYGLVKIVANTGGCATGWTATSTGAYCAKELYSGRFIVTNLLAVDGAAAATFSPRPGDPAQAGVLAIEDLRNVVFFPDADSVSSIVVANAQGMGLKLGEILQDVALLQLPVAGGTQNNVLATTNTGRVLGRDTAVNLNAKEVFNIPARRLPTAVKCNSHPAKYGIEAAASSAVVLVSDRAYCEIPALVPAGTSLGTLVNATVDGVNLTLPTVDPYWPGAPRAYPVIGLTVAPGIGIDFASCRVGRCTVINSSAGEPAAEWIEIKLAGEGNFGATVFQIKSLPDCRYAAEGDFASEANRAASRALCATPGVVINPDGTREVIDPVTGAGSSGFPPAAQVLNVTPLLPADVKGVFDNSGAPPKGLPELLISPQYHAQQRRNYHFGAIFVVPAPGVQFKDTFTGEYDVVALENATDQSLGCTPASSSISELINWDVTTTVSESYVSVGGRYIDSLANVGCGSIKGSYSRLSMLPYDLRISTATWGPTIKSTTPVLTTGNDAVFARLVDSLFNDLGQVQSQLACKAVDGPAAPLSYSTCKTLASKWAEARYKLDLCLKSSFEYAYSRPFCTHYFPERLGWFEAALPTTPYSTDVANRLGELKSRVEILQHLYDTRFLPSIPKAGFCREKVAGSYTSRHPQPQCVAPW